MNAPLPPRPPPSDPQGSLGLGFGLAWACLIGGYTVCSVLLGALSQLHFGDAMIGVAVLLALLPWAAMVGLIVLMVTRGQTRTAKGIGIGMASIFGLALLLVAACFGLLSTTSFH